MRLYNTEGAAQVDDPEYGSFKPNESGAFDGLPDGMYAKLFGRPGWESEEQRTARLVAEQLEKLRDPATMLAEMQKMTAGQDAFTKLLANALGVAKSAEAETPAAAPEAPPAAPAAESAPAPVAEVPTEADAPAPAAAGPARAPADTVGAKPAPAKPRGRGKAAGSTPAGAAPAVSE